MPWNVSTRLLAGLLLICGLCAGCTPAGWIYMTPFDVAGADVSYDDTQAVSRLAVAAVSTEPDPTNKAYNLLSISNRVAQIKAAHPDLQVAVFCELSMGSIYELTDAEYQTRVAETIPGPSTSAVAAFAAQFNTIIVFGMSECENGKIYNSQAIVYPDGVVKKYRKRGLNEADIAGGFTPGNSMTEASIGGVPVTFMICSDYQGEDVIRDVAKSAAKVVIISLGTATRMSQSTDFVAREVGKWVVFANRFETRYGFTGFSFVADPAGKIRTVSEGKDQYVYFKPGVY